MVSRRPPNGFGRRPPRKFPGCPAHGRAAAGGERATELAPPGTLTPGYNEL